MSAASQRPIVMGSCYLDKGEGRQYVTEQVQRMAKQKAEYYFFDIICRPDQLKEATEIMLHFYYELGEHFPEMVTSHVYTGITCDEMVRPAGMALALMSGGSDHAFKDVNPERPGR